LDLLQILGATPKKIAVAGAKLRSAVEQDLQSRVGLSAKEAGLVVLDEAPARAMRGCGYKKSRTHPW
jgi:hypothetical protein